MSKLKAIILMGGEGLRCKSDLPKQFLNLSGKKIYLRTLDIFLSFTEFIEIILVCNREFISQVQKEIQSPRIRVVVGGNTRQASSYQGLLAAGKETDYVVIHDAVRPFVSHRIIEDNLKALEKYGAIDTCIPSTDTIVYAKNRDTIDAIPNRSEYWRGQTPQSFSYPLILQAHEKALHIHHSDDCSLVLELGEKVHIIQGSEDNIKITNELDLFLAEQLFRIKKHPFSPNLQSLNGKRFAITGGTGGIGNAIASFLKKEGADSLIISPSSPSFPTDLTDFTKTKNLFESIYKEYGELDGLINCMGQLIVKPFYSLSQDEIDSLIRTNLSSLIYCCQLAQIKKGGHIVNLSSSSFSRGRKEYAVYSSTKAAIVNFTQGLSEERGDFHINVVVPQRTNTKMRTSNFPDEDPSSLLPPEFVAEKILEILKQEGTTGSIFEIRKH